MRSPKGWWLCCLPTLIGTFSANAAEFEWVPLSATGSHAVNGNTIVLQGGGQEVTIQLRMSGWDPGMDGNPLLGAFQATIDSTGYTSGAGSALNPLGWPDSPSDGAFQALNLCTVNQLADPNGPPCGVQADCPGEFCIPNIDWVFFGLDALNAIATTTLNYEFAGTSQSSGAIDDGTTFYGATVILAVPVNAAGSYTIGFVDNANLTFMRDTSAFAIPGIILTPAIISIACSTNADCQDGNACTDDVCNPDQTCSNANNFDDAQFCCNPATSNLTPLDDGNECTDNVCDSATGSVTHPSLPSGISCGDPSTGDCDNPDTCNGLGTCAANLEPSGTFCGDGTNTDCNAADTCDGLGNCSINVAPAGTLCGEGADTDCDNPDSCNGTGACLLNQEPDGTVCNDGSFCTVGDNCVGGACDASSPRDCDDGLACTTDICDDGIDMCQSTLDPNRCFIGGECFAEGDLNPADDCQLCDSALATNDWSQRPVGSECDDGNPCTGTGRPGVGIDACDDFGVCVGIEDPECNDDCAFAIEAREGSTASDNTGAGPDDAEASCQLDSNSDIWFFYTASCDGAVFVSTLGSILQPSNDPVLSVYDACDGNEIACDDDSGVGLQAALTFTGSAGVDYLIRVAGFQSNTGSIVLNIDTIDDCVIDDVCYAAGDINPSDDCEMCIPALSTDQWLLAPEGTPCGDPIDTECDSPDACNGAGVCEANLKPDGTVCSGDGNDCSFDVCMTGACSHPPQPEGTACGDDSVSECDDPDSCDDTGDCLDNFVSIGTPCGDPSSDQCNNPDICDGTGFCSDNFAPLGTPCFDGNFCTRDDICAFGQCTGAPIPVAPFVVSEAPKVLHVTPQPPGTTAPVALRVTSPDWPCLSKYIGADGRLTDTPVSQVADDWATVIVRGKDIVPSTLYEVVAECGEFTSSIGSDSTCLWADVDCSGTANFQDVQFIILGFKSEIPPELTFEALDIWPCEPNLIINFVDVQKAILAFQGETYQEAGCPGPCP